MVLTEVENDLHLTNQCKTDKSRYYDVTSYSRYDVIWERVHVFHDLHKFSKIVTTFWIRTKRTDTNQIWSVVRTATEVVSTSDPVSKLWRCN